MVYLVDDDVDDLEIVQEALEQNDYKGPVKTLTNGQRLMDELNNSEGRDKPAVIVLDLNMPLKNGFDALTEIRSDPSLKDIPIIILTASSKKEDEIRCFELGCNYFYIKPSSMQEYRALANMVKRFSPDLAS
jgi:CheY-like chemotaxis protein